MRNNYPLLRLSTMQDILGLNRTTAEDQQYRDPITGLPMIQNLTACRQVVSSGSPSVLSVPFS